MATNDEAVAQNKLQLEIVTPRGRALSVLADEVTAPGSTGEFGVMPGHILALTALRTGIVSYREAGGEPKRCAIGAGFAESGPNRVVLLTDDYIERPQIDPVIVRKELAEIQTLIGKAEAQVELATDGPPRDNPDLRMLIRKENWLAAQLELYGDPPFAVSRPYEEFGPPAPPPEDEVPVEASGEPADAGKRETSK